VDATVAGITVPTATGTGTGGCGATAGAAEPLGGSGLDAVASGGGAGRTRGGTAGAVACGRGGPTMKTSAFNGGLPGGIWSVTCRSCGSGVGVFRLTSPAWVRTFTLPSPVCSITVPDTTTVRRSSLSLSGNCSSEASPAGSGAAAAATAAVVPALVPAVPAGVAAAAGGTGPVIGSQSFCAGHHEENSFAARLRTSDAASELGERIRSGV
jgi:hypothetical protein